MHFKVSRDAKDYIGRFKTRDLAVIGAKALFKLDTGDKFHIGSFSTFKPHMNEDIVIDEVRAEAEEEFGSQASTWLDNLKDDARDDLQLMLDLCVLGWLVSHDLIPPEYEVLADDEECIYS